LSAKGERVAVFDVGTNTVLYLLAASAGGGRLKVLDEGVAPTRLGEGLSDGAPVAAAVGRTLEALASFVARAQRHGAADCLAVGTEVLRRGLWRKDFLGAVQSRLGLDVRVLSPEEEGALVLLAARRSLELGLSPVVAVDVGGGSVQVARERLRGGAPDVKSFQAGSVLITEEFLKGATAAGWAAATTYLRRELAALAPVRATAVVAGGTATAVAAIEQGLAAYDAARIHGYAVTAAGVLALAERVYKMPLAGRRGLPGMPEGRADIFPAGALVIATILTRLKADRAVVSVQGVRYGVAYRYFDNDA